MKICTNCGSMTELPTDKCPACHMYGGMRPYEMDVPTVEEPEPEETCCPNCGTNQMGEGPKCRQCRFPLTALRTHNHHAHRRAV